MAVSTTTRHLLGLREISRARLTGLLESAESFLPAARGESGVDDVLSGRLVGNLFLENSTRTRGSFTVAAKRLGADTVSLVGSSSSTSKGETLVDTARNIAAMGVDALVMRCSASGGAHLVSQHVDVPVINAGDGKHEHPTQGLLDALALTTHRGEGPTLEGATIAIVGDIGNSRVARSGALAFTKLGADVIFVGPPSMAPSSLEGLLDDAVDIKGSVSVTRDLDSALPMIDAAVMLRVQFERGSSITGDYARQYGLDETRAASMPDHAVVMHPGPVNRGLEIAPEVCDGPRSLIMSQVTCGVAVRMAVLMEQLAN